MANSLTVSGRISGTIMRDEQAASQTKALERGTRDIEMLAAAVQKGIELADMALRMMPEKAVVNAAIEAFKLPSALPANVRKLLQQRALKGIAGFDDAATSTAMAPTPFASAKRLDMDDAGNGDNVVDLPEDGSEQENEEVSAIASK
jgi:hypothetical protein